MEIKILEESKNKIKFELISEGHTFCNALRSELWENKATEIAGYNIEHPLVSNPVFILETKDGNPKKALLEAVSGLKKKTKELRDLIKKVK